MKYNFKKSFTVLIVFLLMICTTSYAHSGRTDSNGGHRDNQNKSGLGSYHYHCGGHPAHLHTNGVCPYSSSSSSSKKSSGSKTKSSSSSKTTTSSSTKTNTKVTTQTATQPIETTSEPSNVEVTEIQIRDNVDSIEVGKRRSLTTTVLPENATDKSITWKSSNENVATISSSGELQAKSVGKVEITATSVNGKTSVLNVEVVEQKNTQANTENTSIKKENTNTASSSSGTSSNPAAGIITLGAIGGGCYLGYRKIKGKIN